MSPRRVVLLTCAGCVLAGTAAARPHTVARTTAANRRAAISDAAKLLADVVAPPGAAVRSRGKGMGPHAPLLTAAFASAVAYETWTVPGDSASVLSFVEAHLPAGSRVVGTGYGGPNPASQSVTLSWPTVKHVLDGRWLEVDVTSRASGGTRLHAEAQSQWVVTRPPGERIPAGVRDVDVTSGWPGQPPLVSRLVTNRAQVRRLVGLFDSLEIVQPGAINCPDEVATPTVVVRFRGGATNRPLAEARVSSTASFSWPANLPGWSCFPVTFSVLGHRWSPLVGNVITPIQRLLRVDLSPHR